MSTRNARRENYQDDQLTKDAKDCIASAQCTALESQLCRCLRKDTSEQQSSIKKYLAMYADVPPASVHKTLWAAAQQFMK